MEPTYRITTEHDPSKPYNTWEARVVRLSDGETMPSGFGETERFAVAAAVEWMHKQATEQLPGRVLFADEAGVITHGGFDGDDLHPRAASRARVPGGREGGAA